MISLLLAIIFTVILFVCFKEFTKKDIDTSQAITFNYFAASILGLLFYENSISIYEITTSEWIYPTIALGFFFIIMFNIMAITTQKLGISIASMASKMSLIIPFSAALYLEENADFSLINGVGILIALIAIYLTFKKNTKLSHPITIAIILFFGAGILDTSLNYIEENFLVYKQDHSQFIMIVFFVAFLAGLIKIIYSRKKIRVKNIIAGIILGIPNYFSIYFALDALNQIGGAIVFPVLNIGVVLLSSIISFKFYSEYLSKLNWGGITLACLSIILILVY